jgi:hypothetical protein
MKLLKLFSLLSIAFLLISCTFIADFQAEKTGEIVTVEISEAHDGGSDPAAVKIEMGGGTLNLRGGTDMLVEGEINYNFYTLEPTVSRTDNQVTISQKTKTTVSLPQGKLINDWELQLGSMPLALSINTGAYEGKLNLGGLSLTSLSIADGASSSRLFFDEPNAVPMTKFTYTTGASDVELHGLGNANVSEIRFSSGVGNYLLDFSGEDATGGDVSIKSGVSSLKIIIPANARAEVIINGELSDVDLTGTWTVENNRYFAGSEGALIRINIDMAVGSLQLVAE